MKEYLFFHPAWRRKGKGDQLNTSDFNMVELILHPDNLLAFGIFTILIFLCATSLSVFSNEHNNMVSATSDTSSTTNKITLGLIQPDIGKADEEYYKRLADYLNSKIGTSRLDLITTNSTEEIVNLINEKKIDIYVASSLIAALVDNKTGAIPILETETKGADKTHSVIITKRITGPLQIFLIADLLGKKMGITDLSSGVEYLLPKAYLLKNGLTVNPLPQPPLNASKTSVNYVITESADNTTSGIIEGKLGAGAISTDTYEHLPKSIKSNLKVIGSTPEVPLNFVSHRPGLNSSLVNNIKTALLNINNNSTDSIIKSDDDKIKFTQFDDKSGFSNLTKTAILSDLYNSCDPVQIFTVKDYC